MSEFIHSILATNQVQAADGDVVIDLPVNPLSVILLHISPLNDTAAIADYRFLEALLGGLSNVRVSHKGGSVFDMSGIDAAALALLWHRVSIWQSNAVETDNDRRSVVLPILFGRRAYLRDECFPETKKGELSMTLTFDIAGTGYDALRFSVETIELLGAAPSYVQKATTLVQTFAASGQNDVELPIGNVIRAILAFGTTAFAGATPAPTLGQLEVLKDNRQFGYTSSDFEVLRATLGLAGVAYPPGGRHIHSVDAAGVAREDTLEPQVGGSLDDNYVLLNFDPLWDDDYVLETEGAGRVNVRVNAETADAVRMIPIERVDAAVFTG